MPEAPGHPMGNGCATTDNTGRKTASGRFGTTSWPAFDPTLGLSTPAHSRADNGCMVLTQFERQVAAEALEQVLQQIQQGKIEAKMAEIAYVRGALAGLLA